MHLKAALFLMALGDPAWATCGGDAQTFLSCQIENSPKTLSVCYDDEVASYRFGPADGASELEMSEAIAALKYTPWPGVGSAI